MAKNEDLERCQANSEGEWTSAFLYRAMAKVEPQPNLAEVYLRLAAVEEKHAQFWEDKVRKLGGHVGAWKPGWRTRVIIWVANTFGPQAVVPIVAAEEGSHRGMYDGQPESASTRMPADERSHARILNRIVQSQGGMQGGALAQLEGRHRGMGGNALRAAVLGSADGLVSNLSLVMGVAGAQLAPHQIVVTGTAGLLAGACSMAIGEWVSVQSARELNARQLEVEADELEQAPEEEEEELGLIYQAKGLSESEAKALAKRLISDKDKALDTLAREELGIDPQDLGGSAWVAAATSFVLFSFGAVIPLIPLAVFSGPNTMLASLLFSAVGLFGIGAAITIVTGRPVVRSGLRQMVFGLAAAAVTYGLGHLIGASVAG